MNTKRKLLSASMVLIGALLLAAFAATSTSQADEGKIVGTWNVNVSPAGGPPILALTSFHEDGTLTDAESGSEVGTGLGVWARKGHSFAFTFELFLFDQSRNSIGRVRVRAAAMLNDADHISGKFAADFIAPNGQVTPNVNSGTFTGTRLKLGAVP